MSIGIEVCTGRLYISELDDELIKLADDIQVCGISMVYITYGFGCRSEKLTQSEDIPLSTNQFLDFVINEESTGVFKLGEDNLHVRAGRVDVLLCHESDIHCSGPDCMLLRTLRIRWRLEYEQSWERRSQGPWRRLRGRSKKFKR